MRKSRRGASAEGNNGPGVPPPGEPNPPDGAIEGETTGRYLVLFREDAVDAGIRALGDAAGIQVVRATAATARGGEDADDAVSEALAESGTVVFETLGVAVVSADPGQVRSLGIQEDGDNPILAIEPERINYALEIGEDAYAAYGDDPGALGDYLRGYRDGVNQLIENLLQSGSMAGTPGARELAARLDESSNTWGLQATRVVESCFTGSGISLAVLDTGMDLNHPDFAGRHITSRSFIRGQAVQDGHGHGTHCIGTACGPLRPGVLPRYGVAHQSNIFAGKVLSNQGSGADAGILAGIEWAITNRCQIISMSLGSAVRPGETFSPVYEAVARRALAEGTLIIAAAGNESDRANGVFAPVGRPANCPSILAVGALDSSLRVANFSCRGINPDGGQVDIAGPGVAVRSSWPMPRRHHAISGTSMATPHVAGIAALHSQASDLTGTALQARLLQAARRLTLPATDVGSGLVQAP